MRLRWCQCRPRRCGTWTSPTTPARCCRASARNWRPASSPTTNESDGAGAVSGSPRPPSRCPSVFRPHEEEVLAIVPPPPRRQSRSPEPPSVGLVTLGRGYRSCSAASAAPYELAARRSVYTLLWRPHRWAVDWTRLDVARTVSRTGEPVSLGWCREAVRMVSEVD